MSSVEIISLNLEKGENIAFGTDLHADSHPPGTRTDMDYMEVAVGKLRDILKMCKDSNVKALFLGGDIFHRVATTFECVRRIGNVFLEFKKAGIFVGSIVGNHDIARNQLEKLSKSPLTLLFEFGVLERLAIDRRIIINGQVLITPVGYLENFIPAHGKAKHNIMIGHMFYEVSSKVGEGHILTKDVVNKLCYDAMFLGHDHILYPVTNSGRTDIIRPGSVLRGTSHNYNFDREVGFYILKDPMNYSVNNYEFVPINIRPMRDVASSLVLNKKDNLADLSGMMSDLVRRLTEKGIKYDGVLENVKNDKELPEPVRDLLLSYFREEGILVA